MAKVKTVFFCKECGYESGGYMGKCPACQEWNTFVEKKITNEKTKEVFTDRSPFNMKKAKKIEDIESISHSRVKTGYNEFDRVLGGGIVPGSLVLIAGDPGIGKSTLMLMLSGSVSKQKKVLYVSGEESESQIKMRAQRLNITGDNLFIYSETSISDVLSQIEEVNPSYVIIDSVQTLYDSEIDSVPGSVTQIREITATLMKLSKQHKITVFIVGHVTKDGGIAGPRVLEHMVDTVLYFEGERHMSFRILRCVKNRFGSTREIGVFEMRDVGLVQVENPSQAMLTGRPLDTPGTAVVCTMEGSRPMLVEIQALISNSNLTNPRRMSTGFDYNRVSLLLAVLEKRAGFKMYDADAFVNVIGGIKIYEPAADLGLAAAIISSYTNKVIPHDYIFFGEIGLTGEVRAVSGIEKRINESVRLNFKNIVVPHGNKDAVEAAFGKNSKALDGVEIIYINNIQMLSF